MEFSTRIKIPKAPFEISHRDCILLSGSCFTENIGHYLKQNRFQVCVNPFGIIYHPLAIAESLQRIARNIPYTADELWQHDGLFLSPDHHGSFSREDAATTLQAINTSIDAAHRHFNASGYLILTFGTAWMYEHIATGKVVANCHKIPNTEFRKSLLSIPQITAAFDTVMPLIGDKKILFTVSPVRHWRDGAVENQRSKSILIESIHQLKERYANAHYFPAYEIMMDELRDYRFYEEDMLHPSRVAVQYIWEKFGETCFSERTQQANAQLEKIHLMEQHRAQRKDHPSYAVLQQKLADKKTEFRRLYPEISL